VIAVAVCSPQLYHGRVPPLSCMLPASASSVAKAQGLPRVSPDALMIGARDNERLHTHRMEALGNLYTTVRGITSKVALARAWQDVIAHTLEGNTVESG